MISENILQQLDIARSLVTALVEDLDEQDYRTQHHPEMSPPGWHLGHCMYIECYWLHEILRGDSAVTRPLEKFYTPPHTPKAERGPGLPPLNDMLEWVKHLQDYNNHYLRGLPAELLEHDLMKDDYLLHFLIQHYAQHYENLLMILSRRALHQYQQDYTVHTPLQARRPDASPDSAIMHKGHYRIGGQLPLAYDNELPNQEVQMSECRIAVNPVSNAE